LKARARYLRWSEEVNMVKAEMYWVTLWFKHQEQSWEERLKNSEDTGRQAYAAKQQDLWARFQNQAENKFANNMYIPL
jgi:hypothetical protein